MDGAEIGEDADILFDERWYRRAYPDIERAIQDGTQKSGLAHYLAHGRKEGRHPVPFFDATWYSSSYPFAVDEAGSADPTALERHYLEFGRYRGCVPNRLAERPHDPAGIVSRFGGLWIDQANVRDMISGKYEIGLIGKTDATHLAAFAADGYVILPSAIPPVILDRAEEAFDAVYSGTVPEALFECPAVALGKVAYSPKVREAPAKALDMHWYSESIRDLIFSDAITHCLHLIFERPALASQSLGFYRGSAQPFHQDSAYVAYSLPLQFAASWIALEDVEPGAGELEYLVGSHRALAEFTYPGGSKSVYDAQRLGEDDQVVNQEIKRHVQSIESEGRRLGLCRERFCAKRGDVLIWHSDLAHGGSPISLMKTRKSVVTHYCPKGVYPLFVESSASVIKKHGPHGYYVSGVYPAETIGD